jgi:hypothetical protein
MFEKTGLLVQSKLPPPRVNQTVDGALETAGIAAPRFSRAKEVAASTKIHREVIQ